MFKNLSKIQNLPITLTEVFSIYLGFWFLLNNLTTDGVWETVFLNVLFFLVFPIIILKQGLKDQLVLSKINCKICLQILGVQILVLILVLTINFLPFLKLNYLSRMDWFLNDWWAIFFIDLVLLPIILVSQEFFFRNFLINRLAIILSNKAVLIVQASLFVGFEILFFEIFNWQFILFNYILALFLGWFYLQTKSIWYSFFTRWILILLLDGVILYKIQNIKL